MSFLEINGLKVKYFYGAEAIKDFSLSCEQGEVIALISANEGGKTTVLKTIAGLTDATGGNVICDGVDVTKLKTKQRDVCFMFDDGGILRYHSVRFHLNYPMRLRKVPRAVRKETIKRVSAKYHLNANLTDFGKMLYEDDVVRLSFARAEIRKAKITLIDNIFSLMKSPTREKVFKELSPEMKNWGGAVIFATDSINEAFSVADRVVFLNCGFVHQIDSPNNLIDNPGTLLVEKSINSMRAVAEAYVQIKDGKQFCNAFGYDIPVVLNDSYTNKKVNISCDLFKIDGENKQKVLSYYFDKGRRYALCESGFYVEVDDFKDYKEISYSYKNVRLFDYSTEKRIYKG